jgi:hypothetical protein
LNHTSSPFYSCYLDGGVGVSQTIWFPWWSSG